MSDAEILSAELAEDWVEANNRRTALDFLWTEVTGDFNFIINTIIQN